MRGFLCLIFESMTLKLSAVLPIALQLLNGLDAMKFEFMRNDTIPGLENHLVVVQIDIYNRAILIHSFKLNILNKSIEDFDFSNFYFDKATVTVKSGSSKLYEKTIFGRDKNQTIQVGLKEKPGEEPPTDAALSIESAPAKTETSENSSATGSLDHWLGIVLIGFSIVLISTKGLFSVQGIYGAISALVGAMLVFRFFYNKGFLSAKCPNCKSADVTSTEYDETVESVRTEYRRVTDSVTRQEVERAYTVTDVYIKDKIKCHRCGHKWDNSHYVKRG